jgi:hypothetical protein
MAQLVDCPAKGLFRAVLFLSKDGATMKGFKNFRGYFVNSVVWVGLQQVSAVI